MTEGVAEQKPHSGSVAWFPVWLAALAAIAEVLVRYGQGRFHPLQHRSPDFPWMAPLSLLTVVFAISLPVLAVKALRRSRLVVATTVFVTAAVCALDLLLLVPGLAHYAAALLAAGLSVQLSRAALKSSKGIVRLMRRSALPLAAALVVTSAGVTALVRPPLAKNEAPAAVSGGRPNVLFITLDTVRAANLSLYGYARATSPRIDEFAKRGVVFNAASSAAPWTLPSHASMFTGRWPHELSSDYDVALDGAHPTLAEFFGARGYRTAGFVANLRYCGASTGLARGFSAYEDYGRSPGTFASSSTLIRSVADNFRLRRIIENDQHLDRVPAQELNRRALSWLGTDVGRPFFVFMNYFDAHEPYLPPVPFDRRFGNGRAHGRHSPLHHWLWNPALGHRDLTDGERQEETDAYDGSLAHLDFQLGALLDELERRGLLANTIVAITSDHGEEFGEHGVYDHGYSLYQRSLHVPLVIVGPGVPRAGRVEPPVSLRDIAATLTDLAAREKSPFPGTSLSQLWTGAAASSPAAPSEVYSELRRPDGQPDWFPVSKGDMRSVRMGDFRYIRGGDGAEELYDVVRDPLERQNLAADSIHAARLAAARAVVDRLKSGGR